MKVCSKQVRNDYIREAEERLEACLARETEEKACQEAVEKARLEAEERARKEAEEKVVVEVVATEAKAKVDTEEATLITAEEVSKAKEVALTHEESSNSDLAPLVLKTLEEVQKEQQLVRARFDQHDSVNSNIQTLMTQLLHRIPLSPNP